MGGKIMNRKLMLFLFLIQAIIFNITNVITPTYLSNLGLEKYHFGYFTALWSLGLLIGGPVWGTLGDLYGRKKFVVIGLLVYGVSQFVFFYTNNLYILIIFRMISGFGVGAPVTLLMSHLIAIVPKEKTAKYLGWRIGLLTFGTAVSYQISGLLGLKYTSELFLLQSILTIGFIILIFLIVKEEHHPHCLLPKQLNMFSSIKYLNLLNFQNTLFLVSITLTTMTFINVDKFLDVFVIDSGYNSLFLGNIKMIFGFVTIISSILIIPRIKKYLGNIYILQTLLVIMSIIVLITFSDKNVIVMLYTIFLLYIVGKSIYTTSEQVFLTNKVQKEDLGLFIGLRQSFTCLGMILGPIIGGHIYQSNKLNLFVFSVIFLLTSSVILSIVQSISEGNLKVELNT